MSQYIDAFVLPIPKEHLAEYKNASEQIADIWKEYGATAYFEFVGDDLNVEGIRPFTEVIQAKESEEIIFGWVVFPSKEIRDKANVKVPLDPSMNDLVAPLIQAEKLIFDASRMVYGGFSSLVEKK